MNEIVKKVYMWENKKGQCLNSKNDFFFFGWCNKKVSMYDSVCQRIKKAKMWDNKRVYMWNNKKSQYVRE